MVFSSIVTVLCASRYSFADESEKGRMVEGCKIRYVESWCDDGTERQNSKGVDIFTATIDYADYEKLMGLPADFDATFSMRKNAKDQAVLHVETLQYVQPFKVTASASVPVNDEHGKAK